MAENSTAVTSTSGDQSWLYYYGWIIAVIIVVVASVISNFGLNLQKLALHVENDKRKKTVMWLIGICCVVCGSLGDFFALAYGAQSIVAPLGSMTVVSNVFLAPIMQHEILTRQDIKYTAVIIAGCVCTVAFAAHNQPDYSIQELFSFYHTTAFRAYITIIVLILAGVSFMIHRIEKEEKISGHESAGTYSQFQKFHRFSYAAISGIAGAQSVLFAKLVVQLVKATINGGSGSMFLDPYSYLVLLAMATCIVLQIYWLNCGLARWDALYNVPIFQSFWISFSELGGGVVYGEFSEFSFFQGFMFLLGSAMTVYGVYQLSQRAIEMKHEGEGGSRDPSQIKLKVTPTGEGMSKYVDNDNDLLDDDEDLLLGP